MSTNTKSIEVPVHNTVEVKDLVKYYPIFGGVFRRKIAEVKAVDGVSFSIRQGETLGLVGESGCGKSTVSLTMLKLLQPTSGKVVIDGENIFEANAKKLKTIRRNIQIVFQDPFASLDPRVQIGKSISEGLKIHSIGNAEDRYEKTMKMFEMVGLEESYANRYPHEFSGGQRQRIGIARALILNPNFIVLDEPVSALDVSIQAQILNLLQDLQQELNLTFLFVAHNLAVVEHISHRVAVMYLGRISEIALRDDLYHQPLHPYTQALISAIPKRHPNMVKERIILSGDVPSPLNPPSGCRFHPRCPVVREGHCDVEEPELRELRSGHMVACHYAEDYL